jgi:Cu+-exporting ATPase
MIAKGMEEKELLFYAASAEKGSEHPLGESIIKKAQETGLTIADSERFQAIPGHGIKAVIQGKVVLLAIKFIQNDGVDVASLIGEPGSHYRERPDVYKCG